MPYAHTTDRPNVGDRVRHASGRVGTVIFVQRDSQATQAREQIRVRWDDKTGGAAPHLANEYSLLQIEEMRQPHGAAELRKNN